MRGTSSLHDLVESTLPGRPRGHLGTVRVDGIPVKLTSASVDIHLVGAEPTSALPEEPNDPEENNDGESEVLLEETIRRVQTRLARRGGDGVIELGSGVSDYHQIRVQGNFDIPRQ